MHRILIDTDAGVDDALAIILALKSPALKVEAITTVSGNVHVDFCTRNVMLALDVLDLREYPIIAKGEAQPLVKPLVTAAQVHGSDGLGEVTKLHGPDGSRSYPDPELRLATASAADLVIDLAGQYPNELVLVPLGPLTNIAKAMDKNPKHMQNIREIVLMGGAFETYGNVTTTAEFNIFADPHAAQRVLDFGVPITLVPLDVTHQVILNSERMNTECGKRHDRLTKFLRDATRVSIAYHRQHAGIDGIYMHDALPFGLIIQPDLFETTDAFVQVETSGHLTQGMTIADLRHGRHRLKTNARICVGVNAAGFLESFFECILST